MSKLLKISTATGLLGLITAMVAALSGAVPMIIALGFALTALGFVGALVGAAASFSHIWQSTH